jgi:hypothetical protein
VRVSIIHMCLSVRGALMNWNARQLGTIFRDENGKRVPWREAKVELMDHLVAGREVLPIGECDNFDWKKGCLGHEKEAAE